MANPGPGEPPGALAFVLNLSMKAVDYTVDAPRLVLGSELVADF